MCEFEGRGLLKKVFLAEELRVVRRNVLHPGLRLVLLRPLWDAVQHLFDTTAAASVSDANSCFYCQKTEF